MIDFAFGTAGYWDVLRYSGAYSRDEKTGWISDANDFFSIHYGTKIIGVPQDLLTVTGTEFLVVDDYQEEVPVTEIDDKPNVIDLLYTDEGVNQYPSYPSTDIKDYNILRTAYTEESIQTS